MNDFIKEPVSSSASEAPHSPSQQEIEDVFGPTAEEIAGYKTHLSEVSSETAANHAAKVAKAVSILKKGRNAFTKTEDATSPHDEAA